MNQKNDTPVLGLTLLITIGIFSGGIWWFSQHLGNTNQSASLVNASTTQSSSSASPVANTNTGLLGQVPLVSDRKVDYTKLRGYLQNKDWKSADQETYLRLLDAAGTKSQALGYTSQEDMNSLPCNDLRTVDKLWNIASDGKFGFTAQEIILRALGDYRKMYDQVGWQKLSGEWLIEWAYNPQTKRMEYKLGKEPNFTSPPAGHFPTLERGYNFDVSLDGALSRCQF